MPCHGLYLLFDLLDTAKKQRAAAGNRLTRLHRITIKVLTFFTLDLNKLMTISHHLYAAVTFGVSHDICAEQLH